MVDQAAAAYLNENIAGVLAKALAEMSTQQPRDGADFLAKWLATHAQQEKVKAMREAEEAKLAEEREAIAAMQAQQLAAKQAAAAEKERLEKAYSSMLQKFEDPETVFETSFWQEFVDAVKTSAAPEAVSLCLQDEGVEGTEGPVLCYDHVSTGSSWIEEGVTSKEVSMLDKLLPKGVGVTWAALEDTPEGGFPPEAFRPDAKDVAEDAVAKYMWQPKEEVEAQKAKDAAEDPSTLPEVERLPNYPVYIECVTDVPPVHFFSMTKLGSYLAVPLVYKSYYTGTAIQEAKDFLSEKRAKAQEVAKALEEARAAAEAAGEELPESLPADPDAPEEKKLVMTPVPVKRVLCMDTLGTNAAIDKALIPKLVALSKACAECKSRTEIKQVEAQAAQQIDAEGLAATETDIEAVKQGIVDAMDEECKEMLAAVEEDEQKKSLVQAKIGYMQAAKLAVDVKDKIMALKSWVFADEKIMEIIASALYLFGKTKVEVYPKRKTAFQWETLKLMLDDKFFETVGSTSADGPLFVGAKKGVPEEHTLKYLLELATRPAPPLNDGVDEAKLKEISPALAVVYNLVKAALVYRKADVTNRKTAYLKAKAAAEEAEDAAPFEETPPWELDDDCEAD